MSINLINFEWGKCLIFKSFDDLKNPPPDINKYWSALVEPYTNVVYPYVWVPEIKDWVIFSPPNCCICSH